MKTTAPDRQTAPACFPLPIPSIPRPETERLANGVELTCFENSAQGLVALDLVFPGRSADASTRETEGLVYKLLTEGTGKKTAKQLADAFSLIGASFEVTHHADYDRVSVSCLTRFFPQVLGLMEEVWSEAVYPDKEWKTVQETQLRQHEISLKKTSFLASRLYREVLFGGGNAYGYSFNPEWIGALEAQAIREVYARLKTVGPALALLAGHARAEDKKRLREWLASFSGVRNLYPETGPGTAGPAPGIHWAPLDDSTQASLRMGNFTIGPDHPDSPILGLALEIFGGYFGSRLMSNIREDKGWTYGIYAQRVVMLRQSYWVVVSDVKSENVLDAVEEIRREARMLCEERVPEEELETVKNYLRGQFLSAITHCFAQAERYREAWILGLTLDDLEEREAHIAGAGSLQVQEIARRYLNADQAVVALSGKKPA